LDVETLPRPHDYALHNRVTGKESLELALRTLGYWIFHRFDEEMVTQTLRIEDVELKEAFIEGLLIGIKKESIREGRVLTPESANCLAQVFSQHQWSDLEHIKRTLSWAIDALTGKLERQPASAREKTKVSLFFEATLPLIKSLYSKPSDLFEYCDTPPLLNLARAINYIPILDHFASLEQQLPQRIRAIEDGSVISNHVEFYSQYPLSDETRRNILEAISSLPRERKEEWLMNPMFYFLPFDKFEYGMVGTDVDVAFERSDVPAIRTFFDAINGETLLADLLKLNVVTLKEASRWFAILKTIEQ
jgi:hypothetical protein